MCYCLKLNLGSFCHLMIDDSRTHGLGLDDRALLVLTGAAPARRVTLAARLAGKTAADIISVMLAAFARIEPALRKSITFDNDTAFAQHALLRTMRAMTTWFCDAYASWQKGGVENANGRLRRWLPRQIDIDQVSDEEIQDIVVTANLTPRKCLGFKTPFQAMTRRRPSFRPRRLSRMRPHRAPRQELCSEGRPRDDVEQTPIRRQARLFEAEQPSSPRRCSCPTPKPARSTSSMICNGNFIHVPLMAWIRS